MMSDNFSDRLKGKGDVKNMKRCVQYLNWIEVTLLNDENSSDDEIHDHFIKEGGMTKEEADFYISQRNDALRLNLEFQFREYK